MPIVECEGVSKIYTQGRIEVPALKDVSVTVDAGSFMAIAGPSGSGKTTLLNLIGSLDSADTGTITVDGNDYSNMSASQLADLRLNKIGFIFQAYNLIPVLSAAENVEYVMLLQGVPSKERRSRSRSGGNARRPIPEGAILRLSHGMPGHFDSPRSLRTRRPAQARPRTSEGCRAGGRRGASSHDQVQRGGALGRG